MSLLMSSDFPFCHLSVISQKAIVVKSDHGLIGRSCGSDGSFINHPVEKRHIKYILK